MLKFPNDPPIVVFDLDGTLLNINKEIFKDLGIKEEDVDHYNIRHNKKLTVEQQNAVLLAYSNVEYFKRATFYPGYSNALFYIAHLNPRALVHSLSYTPEIAEYKRELLKYWGLKDENLKLDVGVQKEPIPGTSILIEDDPGYVGKLRPGDARFTILVKQHYNDLATNGIKDEELNTTLYRAPSLVSAVDMVMHI